MIVLVAFSGLVSTGPPLSCVGGSTAEHSTLGGVWEKTNIFDARTYVEAMQRKNNFKLFAAN